MRRYLAQFVGKDTNIEPIISIGTTPNYAIYGVYEELRKRIVDITKSQLTDISETGIIPEQLSYSDFERDACAILYGSASLRAYITVRTLPPNV